MKLTNEIKSERDRAVAIIKLFHRELGSLRTENFLRSIGELPGDKDNARD